MELIALIAIALAILTGAASPYMIERASKHAPRELHYDLNEIDQQLTRARNSCPECVEIHKHFYQHKT